MKKNILKTTPKAETAGQRNNCTLWKMKKALRFFPALLLLAMVTITMVSCSSDENCYSGIVAQADNSYYCVRISKCPEENTREPLIGSLVTFSKENINYDYQEGDEISFIIKKCERIRPEGYTTGTFEYFCVVEPCK